MKARNLAGQAFGRLTVITHGGLHPKSQRTQWLCRCQCGNEKMVLAKSLIRGVTRSCGCLEADLKRARARKRWGKKTSGPIALRFMDDEPAEITETPG